MTEDTASQSSIDMTLNRLSETMQQYTSSALSSVQLPEFGGRPEEDVVDFLSRFKRVTYAFDKFNRCAALNRSLTGPARIWAKENIKVDLHLGNWKQAKHALIRRFAAPDQHLRMQQKLNEMKFDPKRMSLTSYVEIYTDFHRKAHASSKDSEIIRSLSLNLPPSIIKHLNVISDNWTNGDDIKEFYVLVKRIDERILPYDNPDDTVDAKVNVANLEKLLKDLKDSFQEHQAKTKSAQDEVVAAISTSRNRNFNARGQARDQSAPYPPRNNYSKSAFKGNYNQPGRSLNNSSQSNGQINTRDTGNVPPTGRDQVTFCRESYIAEFGKPPYPCTRCGEDHFHRHCPMRNLNFNGQAN